MSTAANDGETLNGQQWDKTKDIVTPFTEVKRRRENLTGDLNDTEKDIEPVDAAANRVRVYTAPPADGRVAQGHEYDKRYDIVTPLTEQTKKVENIAGDLNDVEKEVIPLDAHTARVRTLSTPPADGRSRSGQNLDLTHDLVKPYTEQGKTVANAVSDLDDPRKEVEVHDAHTSIVRTFTEPPVNGAVLPGQQYNDEFDFILPFTEQGKRNSDIASDLGDPRKEIQPLDAVSSLVRVWDLSGIAAELAGKTNSFPTYVSFDLPDTLVSLVASMNSNNGVGEHNETGNGFSAGDSASLSLHLHSRAQGSGAVIPLLLATIKQTSGWGRNVPAMVYRFFEPDNVTHAEVLARLTAMAGATVNAWPKFRPEPHTFHLLGQQASVAANADVQQHRSFSENNVTATWGQGLGSSREFGINVRHDHLPPTIHPLIAVTGLLALNLIVQATSQATIVAAENWPGRNAGPKVAQSNISGLVTPSSVAATSGVTAIPTTGLYLLEPNATPFRYGHVFFSAVVVDFSYFA